MNPVNKILGKEKRKCKNCGRVHTGCPFTDCYSEKDEGPLPDDTIDLYERKFGGSSEF